MPLVSYDGVSRRVEEMAAIVEVLSLGTRPLPNGFDSSNPDRKIQP